jgi:Putative transposase/Transposase zinc-binding domain
MPILLNDTATATPRDTRPVLEVADIFRQHGPAYRQAHALPVSRQRVMHAIEVCRTAALGGHLERCDQCAYERPVYNSCRNRHCPKCQALAKAQWLADRQAELLPVGYFHNVFTLPHELNDLLAANARVLYNLLFRSAAQTLQAFAADPQYGLGGQLGFTAVLHTWDQKLLYHVHLHCVIAGGALAFDGQRWLPARRNYLFPVKALSAAFRDRYLEGVQRAFLRGELVFPGRLTTLATAESCQQWLEPLRHKDWVVYSQPPWGGAEKALEYLSRYTHRIAISNHRLRNLEEGRVTFDYRDRRDGNRLKQLTLGAEEFIRRFLLHVLPAGFCRMRQYGFLGNRVKEERLARCRALLGAAAPVAAETPVQPPLLGQETYVDPTLCPCCGRGRMVVVQRLPAESDAPGGKPQAPALANSS